ncbi:MAG: hypothetical protein KKD66_23045 [Proteobacteria bacterium]|nr:hypothetical protein [Pseudomonadota bacterium]MBU2452911.1 hypothetical protein [Pseudomonadota bacterium]MBU2627501.1 hypothetical protein [Pseudomonadota bacterium]
MSSQALKKEIESRIVRIKMTDGSLVNGQVNILREPGHDRLSDLVVNNNEPFLVVFDATLYDGKIDNPVKHKTIFINKSHIIFAYPNEDQE